ncbi:MAG: PilZ domain-containing protein [Deltaproteobacteria bacterium]|nr:PilZ domain-containing protein [Deltaproteobacteria bacterium]
MTQIERRRSNRTAVDFFVEERRADRSWLHPATSLSTDGLYVLVDDDRIAIDPSAVLDVEFTLPSGTLVTTRARIAYTDDRYGQRGVGLQFVDLDAAQRDAIEAYILASIHTRQRRIA